MLGFSNTTNPVQYSLMCGYVSIRGNKSRYGANPISILGGIATMGTSISFLSASHRNRIFIIGTHSYLSPAQLILKEKVVYLQFTHEELQAVLDER